MNFPFRISPRRSAVRAPGADILLEPYTKPKDYRLLFALFIAFCLLNGLAFAVLAPFLLMPLLVPVLILALLVVWTLPVEINPPVRTTTWLYFAFFISLIVWPNYLALTLPGLPWITAIRITGFPLLFALLICLSVSPEFRQRLSNALGAVPLLWKLLVAFVIIQLLSIALSASVADSINKFVVDQICWTSIFFVSCYVFLTPGRPLLWARILWYMAIFVGMIGLWEHHKSQVPWAGHLPSFLQVDDPAVERILSGAARAATGIYRVQSTFTTSLGLAEYIALTMPFIVHFVLGRTSLLTRLSALISILFLFYIVVLSGSRLGVVGCLLTVLSATLGWGLTRWLSSRTSIFGPAIILSYPAIFVFAIASTFFVGRIRALVWGDGPQQASTESRIIQYAQGMPMVWHNPFGHGVGMAAQTLGFMNGAGVLTIDTYYLSVALEYGVIGFVIFYGMFLLAIWYAAKSAVTNKSDDPDFGLFIPIAASLMNFFVIKSVFSEEANHPLVFMLLGMLVALIYRMKSGQMRPKPQSTEMPACPSPDSCAR